MYKKKKNREETIDGIKVFRSWIYVSKSKRIIARLLNYFSFVFSSYIRGRRLGNYDYLMVESPPLFLGYSAIALAKRTKTPTTMAMMRKMRMSMKKAAAMKMRKSMRKMRRSMKK